MSHSPVHLSPLDASSSGPIGSVSTCTVTSLRNHRAKSLAPMTNSVHQLYSSSSLALASSPWPYERRKSNTLHNVLTSCHDGLSLALVAKVHRETAQKMDLAGRMLELPQVTISTAIVYFHIYFSTCSLSMHDPNLCAQASLFLASKVEENSRRIRDVMNCYYRAINPDTTPLSINAYYWDLKDELLRYEEKLLRVLNFQLSVKHPIHYVLHFVRELEASQSVGRLAFYLCNDSLYTLLCLSYTPAEIACSCIYLAGAILGENISLPSHYSTSSVSNEWYEVFGVHRMQVEDITLQLLDLIEVMEDEEREKTIEREKREKEKERKEREKKEKEEREKEKNSSNVTSVTTPTSIPLTPGAHSIPSTPVYVPK